MAGNLVVGRLADRHTVPVLVTGLALNLVFLVTFALVTDPPGPAVVAMLGIGLLTVLPELLRRPAPAPVPQTCA